MNRATNTAVRLVTESFVIRGPVVEIGSYYMPTSEALSNLRPYFGGLEFIGCDIRPGPGVDRIENAQRLSFTDGSVGTLLMLHLLEHLPRPADAVAEAHRVLRDDGLLVVGVPFGYRLHGFPSDYWRFTASGLSTLLAPFKYQSVFALGPRLKPTLVFAVAAKDGTASIFSSQQDRFAAVVQSTFRAQALRGYWRELDERARDFFGCLLGRAELSARFFDPGEPSKYAAAPAVGTVEQDQR